MKKFMEEFKAFIAKGNVMDMAVGVIIGGAFTAIVNSLVGNVIQPFITLITGGGAGVGGLQIPVNEETVIDFGAFISAIINFLIIAWVVFLIVKALNKMQAAVKPEEEPAPEEPAPVCPHCLEEVKPGATRCPHCGGTIE